MVGAQSARRHVVGRSGGWGVARSTSAKWGAAGMVSGEPPRPAGWWGEPPCRVVGDAGRGAVSAPRAADPVGCMFRSLSSCSSNATLPPPPFDTERCSLSLTLTLTTSSSHRRKSETIVKLRKHKIK